MLDVIKKINTLFTFVLLVQKTYLFSCFCFCNSYFLSSIDCCMQISSEIIY